MPKPDAILDTADCDCIQQRGRLVTLHARSMMICVWYEVNDCQQLHVGAGWLKLIINIIKTPI